MSLGGGYSAVMNDATNAAVDAVSIILYYCPSHYTKHTLMQFLIFTEFYLQYFVIFIQLFIGFFFMFHIRFLDFFPFRFARFHNYSVIHVSFYFFLFV